MTALRKLKWIKDLGMIQKALCVVLAVICMVSAVMTGTLSWRNLSQNESNEFSGLDTYGSYTVVLNKYEKDIDGNATTTTIKNTEFYLYKSGDDTQVGGRYVTDSNGQIVVQELSPGDYYFLETNPSYGYTYDEDGNEEIKKYFFTIDGNTGGSAIVVNAYNQRLYAPLRITKTVQNADGYELTNEQKEIEFEFTVAFSDGGTYKYRIDDPAPGAEQEITSGGTITLKHGQTAIIEKLPVGVQYTVTETPVAGYTAAGTNHQGNIPVDGITAGFVNICGELPDGSLEISKQVSGDGADTDKGFRFTVTFDDNGTYNYTINNGVEQSLASGEKITLKHGETAVFINLPVGLGYTVTEDDYSSDHYIASVEKVEGFIIKDGSKAEFINYAMDPGVEYGFLVINKQVAGVEDHDKEFSFTVTFSDGGTYSYSINEAAEQTLVSGGGITLKHGETVTFMNLPSEITYTVTEDDTDGYIASIQNISGIITAGGRSEANFNNYKTEETTLIVRKIFEGEVPEKDREREFGFTVIINGKETRFTLKAGEEKTFILPAGASYEVLEDDYLEDGYALFSTVNSSGMATDQPVECVFTNIYTGTIYIDISGEKTWDMSADETAELPNSITVNLKNGDTVVETVVVTPAENGEWEYTFTVPKYDSAGNEISYTVEEESIECFINTVDGYNIKNTYIPAARFEPNAEKTISGDKPGEKSDFTFALTALNMAPMPDGSENGVKTIVITGEGEEGFGEIKYTKAGTYTYTITETKSGANGYTYDESVYTLTVVVEQTDGKFTVKAADYTKNGDTGIYDKAIFKNIYTDESEVSSESTSSSEMTGSSRSDSPTSSSGPTSSIETVSSTGPDMDSPKTDDNSNIWVWFILMILSAFGLRFVLFYKKPAKPKEK